jgi:hypothetical protein
MRVTADKPRNKETDKTAIGIDADTVIPTLSTKYIDDAAKMIPRIAPVITADHVNSAVVVSSAGMNGLKLDASVVDAAEDDDEEALAPGFPAADGEDDLDALELLIGAAVPFRTGILIPANTCFLQSLDKLPGKVVARTVRSDF